MSKSGEATLTEDNIDVLKIQELSFGDLVPKSGTCSLNEHTGKLLSNVDHLCVDTTGIMSIYKFKTTPNTQVIIRIKTRTPFNGDGVQFKPKCYVKMTDIIKQSCFADIKATVYSNDIGELELFVGGDLTISSGTIPNTSFSLDYNIEYCLGADSACDLNQ